MIALNVFHTTPADRKVLSFYTGTRMPERDDFRILLRHVEAAQRLAVVLDMLHVDWQLEEHAVD